MNVRTRMSHRVVASNKSAVLREANYDRVTSAGWGVFFSLLAVCIVLMVLWTQVQIAVANSDLQRFGDPRQTIEFEQAEVLIPELEIKI